MHDVKFFGRTALASVVALLVACGGPQPTTQTPEVDVEVAAPVQVTAAPTEEELRERRRAEAAGAFERAATLYVSEPAGSRDSAQIERLLMEAMEAEPSHSAHAWFNIGLARHDAGDTAGAIEAYRRSVSADAGFVAGLANVALIQIQRGEYDAARATIDECLRLRETEPGCNINLAVLYAAGHVPTPGGVSVVGAQIERLRFALGGDPRNADAYAHLSKIYFEAGQLELARLVCETAILIGLDDAVLHNRLGLIALAQDNVIEAYQEFQRAVELDPSLTEAWINIGAMAMSFRDYDVALPAFERALVERSGDLDVRLSYGAALRGVDEDEAAKREYEAVLAARPNHPGALFNMALLHQEGLRDYRSACEYYVRLLNSADRSFERYEESERRLTNLRSLVESLVFLEQADPEDAAACQR